MLQAEMVELHKKEENPGEKMTKITNDKLAENDIKYNIMILNIIHSYNG